MVTTILMDEKALRNRIFVVYRAMQTAARPRLWKNGKRARQVRIPGLLQLPFTREQLWAHAVKQIGPGVTRCPYCEAVGRPAELLTLANAVFDHKVPKSNAGRDLSLLKVWSLDNIVCCCKDCNNLKGSLTYECFVELMSWIESLTDQRDASYLRRCLRTHGQTMQRFKRDSKRPELEDRLGDSGMLSLQEDF